MTGQTTIREVAARAGVSPSTVSRVLNGNDSDHMRPETKERVLRAIEELDYTPVKAAQSLRRQHTQVIGILVPDISNSFFSRVVRGVGSVAFEKDFSSLVCDSEHSVEKESRYLDILLAEGVEGIVFIPVESPDMKRVNRLLHQGIRVVVADRRVEGMPVVEADNRGGSQELTRYVLQLGYRRIAYIAGPQGVSTARDRLGGFQETMDEANLIPVTVRHGNFTYDSGYQCAQEILSSASVDAIMAADDLMAMGTIRALREKELLVPQDIGVTGFDNINFAAIFVPKLTTVEVPAFRLGKEAATRLLEEKTQQSFQIPVQLIPGGSCKALNVIQRRENGD